MRIFCLSAVFLVLCGASLAQGAGSNSAASAPGSQSGTATPSADAQSASSADAGHMHVYRQRRYVGGALAPSIYVDHKQIARVGNGRRVTLRLTPGTHTISSDDKTSEIDLEVKPGGDYYVRIDEVPGAFKGHGRLTLVLPEQGAPEYKLAKPIEKDRVIDKDLIENEPDSAAPNS